MTADDLNAVLAASREAAGALEARIADEVEPILRQAGTTAARRFAAAVQAEPLAAAAPTRRSAMVAVYPTPGQAVMLAGAGTEPADVIHCTLAFLGEPDDATIALARQVVAAVAQRHPPLIGEVGGIGAFRNGPPARPDGEPAGAIFDAALEHRPAGGYGETWWNAAAREVYWVPADWSTDEEEQAALAAFLAIPGVDSAPTVEAESGPPTGDGWHLVWSYALKGPAPSIALPDVPGLAELRHDVCEALCAAGIEYAANHGWTPHLTLDYTDAPTPPPDWILGSPLAFDALTVAQGDVGADYPLAEYLGYPLIADLAAAMRPILDADAPTPRIDFVLRAAGDPGWTPPPASELVDENEIVDRIRRRVEPARQKVVETMMEPALKQVGLSFDATNPVAEGLVTSQHVTNIADTTRLNVMRIVRASYAAGLGVRETGEAIRHGMAEASRGRAELIAQTEIVGLTNGASVAVAKIVGKHAGVTYRKQWATAPGARWPRHETYFGLNGQEVGIDEYFTVGRAQLLYPGDPSGPVHEIARCRCTTLMVEHGEARRQPAAEPPAAAERAVVFTNADQAAQGFVEGLRRTETERGKVPDENALADAERSFRKKVSVSITDDRAALERVTAADETNHGSALYRAAVDKYGRDQVLVLRDGPVDPLLSPGRDLAAGHRLTGNRVTVLRREAAMVERTGPIRPGDSGSLTNGGTEAALRHEYGHQIETALTPEQWDEFRGLLPGAEQVKAELTGYGASGLSVGNAQEAFCELFAVVTDPSFDRAAWAPWVRDGEAFIARLLGTEIPVEAEAGLAGELAKIRSSVEWLTPREAALRAAENTPTGYDPYLYPLSTDQHVVSGLARDQFAAVLKAGEAVEAEMKVPQELAVRLNAARAEVKRAEETAARYWSTSRTELVRLRQESFRVEEEALDRIALERHGVPYRQLEPEGKGEVLVAVNDDPAVEAAKRAYYAEDERVSKVKKQHADAYVAAENELKWIRSDHGTAVREEALRTLGSVRAMGAGDGVELTLTDAAEGADEAIGLLREAQRFLPRDWIANAGPINAGTAERGYFSKRGGRVEIRTSPEPSGIAGDRDGMTTALHELGHVTEHRNGIALQAEQAFYEWRVRGRTFDGPREPERPMGPGYRDDEVTREDDFTDPYMGKDYGGTFYELLSTGLEGLFTSRYELDPEFRRFMLGLLALA